MLFNRKVLFFWANTKYSAISLDAWTIPLVTVTQYRGKVAMAL